MATSDDIVSAMIAALAVSDPDLDTTIGTTTRKILDAVGEAIAESYVDQHMLTYQYDVNSKTGSDLDTFCALFGIARLAAKRATGMVIFTRPAGAVNAPVVIPINTQVGTTDQVPISVVTVTSATIQINQRSVAVPVQAVTGGPSGNIGAGALSQILTPIQGVTSVTNIDALTGGTTQETDAALRTRWSKTVFRSLAGTNAMYLGLALDDPDCYAATVIGASSTQLEQVQLDDSGHATSEIDPDSVKFVYPRTSVVSATGAPSTVTTADYNTATDTSVAVSSTDGFADAGNLLIGGIEVAYTGTDPTDFTGTTSEASVVIPAGTEVDQDVANADILLRDYDYTFDTDSIPPEIIASGSGRMIDGQVYSLSYEYVSASSRNIPTSSINNRVDVWCAGSRPTDAQQSVVYLDTLSFNDGTGVNVGSPYEWDLYERPDGSKPFIGNVFIPLAFGPIMTLPEIIGVDGTNFDLATGITDLPWAYNTTTTMADPTAGKIRMNSGTMASVTALAISVTDGNGNNNRAFLKALNGASLLFSDITSPSKAYKYTVTGVTDNTTWIELAVTVVSTTAAPTAADVLNLTVNTVADGTAQLLGDYQIVHRKDCFGYTSSSLFGIEWNLNNLAEAGNIFTISDGYSYNNIPTNVQALIDAWRLVGVDAQAHQAKQIFLRFNLAVMYTRGASVAQTNTLIGTNLSTFLQGLSFGAVLQVSDVLAIISGTSGVDNVRFLNGSDYEGFDDTQPNTFAIAIQKIVSGAVVETFCDTITGRAIDVGFPDDAVPVFDSISGSGTLGAPLVKAQNTFGVA